MLQDRCDIFRIFRIFGIFGILDLGTLGDDIDHLNMPKDIGKFNFQDFRCIRDIQDFGLGDIERCHRTFEYA